MRNKLVGFLSVVTILALVLSGCSGSGSNGGNNGGNAEGSASGNAGGSGAKVKLTAIMVKHPLTKPLAQMEWLKKAEDAAGVEIEWQEITADWGQKKRGQCLPAVIFRICSSEGMSSRMLILRNSQVYSRI